MSFFSNLAAVIGKASLESLADHIRLENVENRTTLVMKDGTLVSMLRLAGMSQVPGANEIIDAAERMRLGLAPFLSRPGHAISFSFTRDHDAAADAINRAIRMTSRLAQRANLDVSDVLMERQKILSERLVFEQTLVCLYSRRVLMDKEEVKMESGNVQKRMKSRPIIIDGQENGRTMEGLMIRHDSFVNIMEKLFKDTGQIAERLSARDMIVEARAGINPSIRTESEGWTPNLPVWADSTNDGANPLGSTLTMMPETAEQMNGQDFSNLVPITLDRQIATEDAFIEDSQCVRIGGDYFTSFDMSVPPEVLVDFNTLVHRMNTGSRKVPWRCTFLLESGGVQAMALKERYLDFFTLLSKMHNKRIGDAIRALRDIDGETDNIVRFRATFTTWSKNREELRIFSQTLQNAVKSWGNVMIDGMSGDILATTVSTIPGVTLAPTAPTGAGPLTDILCLSPIGRVASPWDTGPVMFRTQSGKAWAFQPGSSRQETWINLFCGTPGSGKSVLLNAINLGTILSSNPSSTGVVLPRISIIDIGSSSSGLISLIKEALPPNMRHMATFKRLTMSEKDAINVFDTPLGARKPTPLDRAFIINFMSIICSSGTDKVSGQMVGLISAAIDSVYERYSDDNNPKKYYPGEELTVDEALRKAGHVPEAEETWWEIVDTLASAGSLYEAEVAQRRAVPLLSDLATAASQDHGITSLYGHNIKEVTGEITVEAFTRLITEISRDYPILSTYTRLDFGSSRIISLDLMDVAPSGESDMSIKQTALMYMVGRQICTREFYQKEDDFKLLVERKFLPKQYLNYHVMRCRENLQIQKVICFDEFHRAKGAPAVIDQVERDAREGRKFNISVNVISQLPEDFSKDMIDMSSGVFICNARGSSLDFLKKNLGLSSADEHVLKYNLTGPSKDGAPFWVMFMIKNQGQIRQELVLTLGPVELWAFSTTAKDIAIRQALYDKIGPKMARTVLAKRFPGGSAQSEIDARIARIESAADRLGDSASQNVINDLIQELTQQALVL